MIVVVLAGLRILLNGEEVKVIQVVKESDLNDLIGDRSENDDAEAISDIRVLILGNAYKGEAHPVVRVSSKSGLNIEAGDKKEFVKSDEKFVIKPDDKRFENGKIRITSDKKIQLNHLERSYGTPSYEGTIELHTTAEGIIIINELPVENYLKAVVPSEMPASYEMEALKAQAVCARSYAYRQMKNYGYPEYNAHVDDSTQYQVYGNSKPQKSTNQAIKDTEGMAVYYQDEIATTYYYSTSCGRTTDVRAWGTKQSEKNRYLKSVEVKGKGGYYEKNLPWYKWKAEISVRTLSDLVAIHTRKDIGLLRNIKVTKRGGGDVAIEIKAIGEKGSVSISTENKIRQALGGKGYQIMLNDGSVTESRELLPSAFFTIEKTGDVFVIEGGGFGHGIGMSQNGANEMAKQGMNYEEILKLFYQNVEIR